MNDLNDEYNNARDGLVKDYIEIPLLSLVVPVFNESESLKIFLEKIYEALKKINKLRFEIIFINDGSNDETLEKLLHFKKDLKEIVVIDLSRNFGKEAALTAGLDMCKGNIVIPIDVDLQDPPELISKMVDSWRDGYEVVLARRISRKSDSLLKRKTAKWFYSTIGKISDVAIPENVGDFRLMDRKVVDALKLLPENGRFMKGLFAWIGFRTTLIDFERIDRSEGITKFNTWKLWNLAIDGITSFSIIPLRLSTYIGFIIALAAVGYGAYILWMTLNNGVELPGYSSLIVSITFLSGIQLIGIGIIGEYLGRTYIESKRRPVYVVRDVH